jgi:hypothetical protein
MVLISVMSGDTSWHIPCRRGDEHAEIFFRGGARQRTDHIVGLHALLTQDGQPHAAHRFEQWLDLRAQIVGHGRALCLVFGEQLVAERLAGSIEHHGDALGIVVLQELREHVQHAKHGTGRFAARIAERWQRVEGAVQVRRTIDQHEIGAGIHALLRRRRRRLLVFLRSVRVIGRRCFLGRGHFRSGRCRCRW